MPGRDDLVANLALIRQRIELAGADPELIQVVAATKGRSPQECRWALAAGITALGENRVQEALAKMEQVSAPSWHLIGHLQRNKVGRAQGRFGLIQSIDSLELAQALACAGGGRVLIEVNIASEPAKTGVPPEAVPELAPRVAELLELEGLMTMAPQEGEPQPHFRRMRRLRDEVEQRLGRALPVLSMGMSQDYPAACREGSTMIRIGRGLFGPPGALAPGR